MNIDFSGSFPITLSIDKLMAHGFELLVSDATVLTLKDKSNKIFATYNFTEASGIVSLWGFVQPLNGLVLTSSNTVRVTGRITIERISPTTSPKITGPKQVP